MSNATSTQIYETMWSEDNNTSIVKKQSTDVVLREEYYNTSNAISDLLSEVNIITSNIKALNTLIRQSAQYDQLTALKKELKAKKKLIDATVNERIGIVKVCEKLGIEVKTKQITQ